MSTIGLIQLLFTYLHRGVLVSVGVAAFSYQAVWASNLIFTYNLILGVVYIFWFIAYAIDDGTDKKPGERKTYKEFVSKVKAGDLPVTLGSELLTFMYILLCVMSGTIYSSIFFALGWVLSTGSNGEMRKRYKKSLEEEKQQDEISRLYPTNPMYGNHK